MGRGEVRNGKGKKMTPCKLERGEGSRESQPVNPDTTGEGTKRRKKG